MWRGGVSSSRLSLASAWDTVEGRLGTLQIQSLYLRRRPNHTLRSGVPVVLLLPGPERVPANEETVARRGQEFSDSVAHDTQLLTQTKRQSKAAELRRVLAAPQSRLPGISQLCHVVADRNTTAVSAAPQLKKTLIRVLFFLLLRVCSLLVAILLCALLLEDEEDGLCRLLYISFDCKLASAAFQARGLS